MAHNRSERIGTIFSRVSALWERKAIPQENLPLWYDVYKTFPPKYEPRYDRPASEKPVKNIFYKEDFLRAKFHKDVTLPIVDLKKKHHISHTQLFLIMCDKLRKLNVKEEEVYDKALQIYNSMFKKVNVPASRRRTESHK